MQDDTRKWLQGQLRILQKSAEETQGDIQRFIDAQRQSEQHLADLRLRATDIQDLLDSSS